MAIWKAAILLLPAALAQLACLDSSGNQDPSYLPCYPDADVSGCCSLGDICLSNSLCRAPQGADVITQYFIGECTSSDSSSTDACKAQAECKSRNSNGVGISDCGNGSYCCYGLNGCDCTNNTQVFSLPGGTIVTTLPTTAPPVTSTPTNSATTTPSASTTTSATTTPTNTGSSGSGSSSAVGIGVGVGVGVGVALILGAIGAWFLIRRRKRKNASPPLYQHVQQGGAGVEEAGAGYAGAHGEHYAGPPEHKDAGSLAHGEPAVSGWKPPQQAEMYGQTQMSPTELDGTHVTHELPETRH